MWMRRLSLPLIIAVTTGPLLFAVSASGNPSGGGASGNTDLLERVAALELKVLQLQNLLADRRCDTRAHGSERLLSACVAGSMSDRVVALGRSEVEAKGYLYEWCSGRFGCRLNSKEMVCRNAGAGYLGDTFCYADKSVSGFFAALGRTAEEARANVLEACGKQGHCFASDVTCRGIRTGVFKSGE